MTHLELAQKYRAAGAIKRWHRWPTLRTQTVAEHSFGVVMLLRQVIDGVEFKDENIVTMFMAALHHDLPELLTGDIPADVKRDHPDLDAVLTRIETSDEDLYYDTPLSKRERELVKWADTMELILWSMEELALGNSNMEAVVRRAVGYLTPGKVPGGRAALLTSDVFRRCAELGYID